MWRSLILGVGGYAERMMRLSRSYKKFIVLKEQGNKYVKRRASRAVRLYKDIIPKGGAYKKLYCSWNICDWWIYASWEEYYKEKDIVHLIKGSEKYKEVYREWYKYYKGK